MKTFHRASLGATIAMVMGVAGAAWMIPAPHGTTTARAVFAPVPQNATKESDAVSAATAIDIDAETSAFADMDTAAGVAATIERPLLDYDLDAVITGEQNVPRLNLVSIPGDIASIRETGERKAMFFKSVLPLVLQVNERILEDRTRLQALYARQKIGAPIDAVDRLWLSVMAERYNLSRTDIAAMLIHHDIVPPSLALAQAATESAWGTSRFVREGNAMFGQWTMRADQKGIVPKKRDAEKTHRIRAFSSLYDSVEAYVTNLNRHRAYREFRQHRARMRAKGHAVDGLILAGALHRYSERGAAYVAEVRSIISGNDLDVLDSAELTLSDHSGTVEPII